MPRSINKGPYLEPSLEKKLLKMIETGSRQPIKTWSRRSVITPQFVGFTVSVHNGKKHIPVFITENMVGYKFGEFSGTRTFRKHGGVKAKKAAQKT
ncbi:MAG: 30S ribosomal protein S19 [Candidatus Omnitrophica bacterium]|nr:30S ribosomal protein S19 [Candidatus Omnitrophota bacterium]MBU1995944.1 30S ribosomal protein S19 [Candidatus Omnitrophota bacterium]MBU4333188.1 30S ribosomal protein S19 [Candidatus Omnitrophota bacterium]